MRTMGLKRALWLAALPAALALAACGSDSGGGGGGGDDDSTGDDTPSEIDAAPGEQPDAAPTLSEWEQLLESRKADYNAALRIASLRLVGRLPTLAEQKAVADAADQKAAYEAQIDAYLADPRFATQIRNFFRDSFRMGGNGLDSAPNFAAQLTVEGKPFTDLFTATAGNCPTFDGTNFTAANCNSGAPVQAGVLTDPAVQRHFYSNMAFRRVRWVQETFACTKYPAEYGTPTNVGGAAEYTGVWAFTSISGKSNNGRIDFQDASSVVCANCHSTMNHQAPLFANFDEQGRYQANFAVKTPLPGTPNATLADFLPAGETTAWRNGVPAATLAEFGAAMAADPDVAECMVARTWNWALGKGDIVGALAIVPTEVIQAQMDLFKTSNYNLKTVIRAVFTADDFVKF